MAMNEAVGAAVQTPLRLRVAAEVRAWRARRNMTQQQLASALGVSQGQMSAKLRGLQPITFDEVDRLAEIFGTSTEEMLRPAITPEATPARGLRLDSAQSRPASETDTAGDELEARRRRRRRDDIAPLLPRPILGRHLRLVSCSA